MERRPPPRAGDGSAAAYGAAVAGMYLGVGLSFAAMGVGGATYAGKQAMEAHAEAQAFEGQGSYDAGDVAAGYAASSERERGYYSFLGGAGVILGLGAGAYLVRAGRRSRLSAAPRQQQRIADS